MLLLYGIILKLITVPITHDESWTIVQYTRHSIWDIIRYPDSWPNNHILNTLLAKLSISIFGLEDWASRIPNALGFCVYAFSAFKISTFLFDKNLLGFLACYLLFFANPYLLDFFSLCRGYGLSMGFLLLAIYYCLSAYKHKNARHVLFALAYSMLAAYANFPALIFWASMVFTLGLYYLFFSPKPIKKIFHLGLFCIAFVGLIISPILKMSGDNQFKYWSTNGFFEDTIMSSIDAWRYGAKLIWNFDSIYLAYILVLVYAIMGLCFIFLFLAADRKKDFIKKPFSILFILLSVTAIVNLVQYLILKTPFLNGRTALLYYPLFVAAFAGFLNQLSQINSLKKTPLSVLSVFIILFSTIHLVDRYDNRYVREWWYDANTKEVIAYLNEKEDASVNFACNWIFHPSFNFYSLSAKANIIKLLPYSKDISANQNAKYYYVEAKDLEQLKDKYVVEKEFGYGRFLLRKK